MTRQPDDPGHGWPETEYDADADEFRVTRRAKMRMAAWLAALGCAFALLIWWLT